MKRNLVQLDGEIVEVKQDKKGKLVATKLSPEELVHVHVLEDSVTKMLDNDFNKIAQETLEEVREGFKTNLRENILRVIGFSNSWGKWEIDHCNGRQSAITEYIGGKVKRDLCDTFDALLKDDIEKMVAPFRTALAKEYKEMFGREVRDTMRRQASEAAKEFLTSLLTNQITKVQKEAIKKAEASFLAKHNITRDSELDD